jgi:TolB protein
VVEVASGQRQHLTTFQPADEFVTQFLPFFDQYALSHQLWSPASDALVVPAVREKQLHVLVVPLDSSQPRAIAEGHMAFWSRS